MRDDQGRFWLVPWCSATGSSSRDGSEMQGVRDRWRRLTWAQLLLIPGACTTIGAVQDLSSPSPVCSIEVTVEEATDAGRALRWSADYRRSPGLHGEGGLRYAVTRTGTLDLPEEAASCELLVTREPDTVEGVVLDQPAVLQHCGPIQLRSLEPPRDGVEPADDGEVACPLVVRRAGPPSPGPVLLVDDLEGRSVARVGLPADEPLVSPGRWLWLVASPAIDAVILPLDILRHLVWFGVGIAS